MSRLILTNIHQLVTMSYNETQMDIVPKKSTNGPGPRRGKAMSDIGEIKKACIVIEDEIIVWVGNMMDFEDSKYNYVNSKYSKESNTDSKIVDDISHDDTQILDCSNKAVLPGFVDSHTHFVFGGYRADEFVMRLSGASYMDIMNAGGGIGKSVKQTQDASFETLMELGYKRLDAMLEMGVTTVEGKSGYGLDKETEIKQLRVMKGLDYVHDMDVVSTFMGTHSIPKDKDHDEYLDFVINEVLPIVKKEDLAEFVDIFCEKGVFTYDESKYYLSVAKELGFKLKIHADEIVNTKGSELAAYLGAISADHLLMTSGEGIKALAQSNTMATLLPLTAFSLKEPYAPAREMIFQNVAIALATDFNPGSSPSYSIPLLIALAALQMKMTIQEIVCALTINGAYAVGRQDSIGSIEVGKQADIIILSYPTIDFLPYQIGLNIVELVVKKGEIVVDKRIKK